MRKNKLTRWLVGAAIAVLLIPGCQWAKWNEVRQGPQVKTADAVGGLYVRVGMGKWTDATGRVRVQPVYVRTDETGPRGHEGPKGVAGVTEVTVIPDRKVDLEKLRDPNATYDAKAGTYKRKIEVVTPIWQSNPAAVFEKVQPLREKGDILPSWDSRRGRLGETEGGGFLGGGFEAATDVARSGTGVMFIIGSLAVLGGIVVAVWAGKVWLGIGIAAGGGALVATAFLLDAYPWLPLVALLVLVGLGVWYVVDQKFAAKAKAALASTQTALSAVVRGVESTPDAEKAAVKAEIWKAAGTDQTVVVDTIREAKAKAGV